MKRVTETIMSQIMNRTTIPYSQNLWQAAFGSPTKKIFPVSMLLGVCLLIPGYGQAGFLDNALDFGKDLLGKAALNYSNKYEKKLNQLLQSLRQPGIVNQPFIQGITPGSPYDRNAASGVADPAYGNTYGGDPYGQPSGYGQGTQPGEYYGQTPGSGYPADPYSGGYPSNDPYDPYNNPNSGYPQGGAYGQNQAGYPNDPYSTNPDYTQSGAYGQTQGGYPPDPNYGGYPPTGQQGGTYGQYPDQGYSGGPNYGNDPEADPSQLN